MVPPIPAKEFGSKDDVQDLQDIQRVFVPTLLELGLSGEQVAKVRSLMLQRRQSARDAKDIAKEHKWSTAGVVIQAIDEAEAKFDPQIRAAVGDEKFEQVRVMLVDESYFRRVQFGIATDAELFGAPLSADQKLTLTRAMGGVLTQSVHPQAAVDPVTGLTPSDQQILDRANGALSNAQSAVLRRYLARQHVGSAGSWRVGSQTTAGSAISPLTGPAP